LEFIKSFYLILDSDMRLKFIQVRELGLVLFYLDSPITKFNDISTFSYSAECENVEIDR